MPSQKQSKPIVLLEDELCENTEWGRMLGKQY